MSLAAHRFVHEAMTTVFEVFIAGEDAAYAGQAARAAFEEIDRVEQALSRFIESSDVSQFNRCAPGTWVRTGSFLVECMQTARQVALNTGTAFDPTVPPLLRLWRDTPSPTPKQIEDALSKVGVDKVELDVASLRIRKHVAGVELDFGGVGKGYALDKAAEILREWGIESALLQSGGSTALALEAPPDARGWRAGLGGRPCTNEGARTAFLRHCALSGSGLEVKGTHILHPATGRPAVRRSNAWSLAPTAAQADALSTAFLLLSPKDIARYCQRHPETAAAILDADSPSTQYWGAWSKVVDRSAS